RDRNVTGVQTCALPICSGVGEVVPTTIQEVGPWTIDREHRTIRLDGEVVKLTDKDFELASYLFQNVGKLMSRSHLLEKVWGILRSEERRVGKTYISKSW